MTNIVARKAMKIAKNMKCVRDKDKYTCTPESCDESSGLYELKEGEITNQCVCTPIAYRNESGECVAKDHDHCGDGDKMEDMAACNANEKCNDSGVCELRTCEERCEGIGVCKNDRCLYECEKKDCKKCVEIKKECGEIEDEEEYGEEELNECKERLKTCNSTYSCKDKDLEACGTTSAIICNKHYDELYTFYGNHIDDFIDYFRTKKRCETVSTMFKAETESLCNQYPECGNYNEVFLCRNVFSDVILNAMAEGKNGIDISTYQNFLIWFALCI